MKREKEVHASERLLEVPQMLAIHFGLPGPSAATRAEAGARDSFGDTLGINRSQSTSEPSVKSRLL